MTINLNGQTVGPGSPAFTINADDFTLNGPGTLDGGASSSPGILVNGGADNFILNNVEIKNWADGVEVAGSVNRSRWSTTGSTATRTRHAVSGPGAVAAW